MTTLPCLWVAFNLGFLSAALTSVQAVPPHPETSSLCSSHGAHVQRCHNGSHQMGGTLLEYPPPPVPPPATRGWSCSDGSWQWVRQNLVHRQLNRGSASAGRAWLPNQLTHLSEQWILVPRKKKIGRLLVPVGMWWSRKKPAVWIPPWQRSLCCWVSIRMRIGVGVGLYLKTFGRRKWKILKLSIKRLAVCLCVIKYLPYRVLFFLHLVVWCSATLMA